jgi:hypothetical protein
MSRAEIIGVSRHVANIFSQLRNRAHRTQADDEASILKGLPIRQWRQTEQPILPPTELQPTFGKLLWPEHPMPRDSHLLPEVSQQLLRAARAGRLYQQSTPPVDEEYKDNGQEEEEAKEVQQGFVVRKWTVLPRHLEESEPEHLAKRRKGLPPSFGSGYVGPIAPLTAFRKTKVKKVDADGNVHIYEVLAPEGQTIEGEVVDEDETMKDAPVETAAAPGTIVEGVGVVNEQGVVVANDLLPQPTPPRRKPPPPRRKPKKGPGRGRKKVLFEDGEQKVPGDGTSSSLQAPRTATSDGAAGAAGLSTEGDTPMPDAQDGDEEEGSGSSGDDGEEGDEGDEGDEGREDGELSPTPEPEPTPSEPLPLPAAVEESKSLPAPTTPSKGHMTPIDRDASSSPELPLSSKQTHSRQTSFTQPPAIDSSIEAPPAEAPPAEAPPTEAHLVEALPVEEPPAEETPAEETPVEETPAEAPVAESLLAEAPLAETTPAEAPLAEAPIAEAPMVDAPVTNAPVADAPTADAPLAEEPMADAPPAETSLAESPPAEAPSADISSAVTPSAEADTGAPSTGIVADVLSTDVVAAEPVATDELNQVSSADSLPATTTEPSAPDAPVASASSAEVDLFGSLEAAMGTGKSNGDPDAKEAT